MSNLSYQQPRTLSRLLTSVRVAPPLLRAPIIVHSSHELRTERLLLRPLAEHDRARYTALLESSNRHLSTHFPLRRTGESSDAVFERHLAFSRGAIATGLACRRIICLHDGSVIGAVNLNDISQGPDRTAEVNFWIGPRHLGMGLCSEAARALIDHALSRAPRGLGLAAVWGYVAPDNHACLRMIARLGFTPDDRALPVQLNLADRWVTHHTYIRRAPAATIALQRLVAAPLSARAH